SRASPSGLRKPGGFGRRVQAPGFRPDGCPPGQKQTGGRPNGWRRSSRALRRGHGDWRGKLASSLSWQVPGLVSDSTCRRAGSGDVRSACELTYAAYVKYRLHFIDVNTHTPRMKKTPVRRTRAEMME